MNFLHVKNSNNLKMIIFIYFNLFVHYYKTNRGMWWSFILLMACFGSEVPLTEVPVYPSAVIGRMVLSFLVRIAPHFLLPSQIKVTTFIPSLQQHMCTLKQVLRELILFYNICPNFKSPFLKCISWNTVFIFKKLLS